MIARDMDAIMSRYDALVGPGRPGVATPLDLDRVKSFKERSSDVMGALGNCIGLPAVTVPSGFSEDDLPTSIQFMGRPYDENVIISVAAVYQVDDDVARAASTRSLNRTRRSPMSQPIAPDHIFDIPSVSQPHLSADGSVLAFVKTTIDRSTMERDSRIVVSHSPFDRLSTLTDGPSDTSSVIDGEKVLFLRPDDRGNKQVWTIPLEGGEPQRVSDLAGGVEEFALSPTGDRIAVVSSVDPDAPEDTDSGLPRVRIVRRIRYRHDYRGFTGDAFRQIFLVDAESGDARQITDGEGDNWSPVWSPDGRSLAFISDDIEGRDFTTNTQVKVVTIPDGEPVSWSEALPYVWAVTWSPDGESLAAIGCHDPEMWDPRSAWLYVLDAPWWRSPDHGRTLHPRSGVRAVLD